MPTTIYVDADACPVKDEIVRVAERHAIPVVFVSNRGIRVGDHPLLRSVLVAQGPDAADDWIAEAVGPADIVITADVPLAARCVASGAVALAPNGKLFDDTSIGMAVAMRDLMTGLRDGGAITGGPPPFAHRDRALFLDALERACRTSRRGGQRS